MDSNCDRNDRAGEIAANPQGRAAIGQEEKGYAAIWPSNLTLVSALLIVIILIILGGWLFYRQEAAEQKRIANDQLAAIANLKVQQIVNWRRERMGDVSFFFNASMLGQRAAALVANPAADEPRREITGWLALLQSPNRYDHIIFLDAQLQQRLLFPEQPAVLTPDAVQLAADALRQRQIVISDLHKTAVDDIHLDLAAPILLRELPTNAAVAPVFPPVPGAAPVGVLLFQINPRHFLYPLIQSWPSPSPTAETLLLRREGQEVLFLNELRHLTNTALRLRLPMTLPDLPSVRGARGESGVFEGTDYRGVPVLAAIRRVPETTWLLEAKVDQAEIYAPFRNRAWVVSLVAATLILAALLAVGLLWRQRRIQYLRHELTVRAAHEKAMQASEARYRDAINYNRTVLAASPVGIITYRATGEVVSANDTIARIIGATVDQVLAQNFHHLSSWKTSGLYEVAMKALGTRTEQDIETLLTSTFGKKIWLLCRLVPFSHEGEDHLLLMVVDTTDRKKAEEQLLASRKQLRALLARLQHAREEERTRIAREVHDVLGQLLTGLKMDLVWYERRFPRIADEALQRAFAEKNAAIARLADTMIETVQKISSDLRPSVLDNIGLCAAIRFEARHFQENTGVTCEVIVPEEEISLPPEHATGVFRIFQEILTNVARHAQATAVKIRFERTPEGIELEVQDNGLGIKPDQTFGFKSFGLLGMRERALLMGGKIDIFGVEKHGTRVVLFVPVTRAVVEG